MRRWAAVFARWPRTFLALVVVGTLAAGFAAWTQEVEFDLERLYAETGGGRAEGPGQILVAAPLPPDDPAWAVLAATLAARPDVIDVYAPKIPDDLGALRGERREQLLKTAWGNEASDGWTAVSATLAPGASSEIAVSDFRQETAQILPESLPRVVVGVPVLNVAHAIAAAEEQRRLLPLVFGFFLVILLVLFRGVWSAVLPLVSVAIAALWVLGLVALLEMSLGGPLLLLLPLVVVLGLADSIHLLRHVAHARETMGPVEALDEAIERSSVPCFLTSLTTAAGFASLWFTQSPMLRSFGVLGAAAMGLALVCAVGIPVAILALKPDLRIEPRTFGIDGTERFLGWVARSRGPAVLWVQLALLLPLGTLAAFARPDLRLGGELPDESPVMDELTFFDEHLGGVYPLSVRVETGKPLGCSDASAFEALMRVHQRLKDADVVGGVTSLVTPMQWLSLATGESLDGIGRQSGLAPNRRYHALYGRAGKVAEAVLPMPLWDEDQSAFLVWVRLHDTGARSWASLLTDLQDLDSHMSEVTVTTSGFSDLAVGAWRTILPDLRKVVLLSSCSCLLCLWIAYRSFRFALVSILPMLLTVVTALATLGALGIPLSYPNLFVLAAAVGVGVDALIHLRSHAEHAGVEASLKVAGSSVVWTYVLLVAGLATLISSRASTVREVGGVLIVAMSVNLVSTLWTFRAAHPSAEV